VVVTVDSRLDYYSSLIGLSASTLVLYGLFLTQRPKIPKLDHVLYSVQNPPVVPTALRLKANYLKWPGSPTRPAFHVSVHHGFTPVFPLIHSSPDTLASSLFLKYASMLFPWASALAILPAWRLLQQIIAWFILLPPSRPRSNIIILMRLTLTTLLNTTTHLSH
jgi:hypothetical protein